MRKLDHDLERYKENMPLKLEDLDEATIGVRIGLRPFQDMCDLGTSVSIFMLTSLYNKLDLGPLHDTPMRIEFTNTYFSNAIGVKEDVIIMLKDCVVPIDFYVIDMPEDAYVPIILGRPFLRTTGAIINMQECNINLLCPIDHLLCISLGKRRRHWRQLNSR